MLGQKLYIGGIQVSIIKLAIRRGVHQNANVCEQDEGGCVNANVHKHFLI